MPLTLLWLSQLFSRLKSEDAIRLTYARDHKSHRQQSVIGKLLCRQVYSHLDSCAKALHRRFIAADERLASRKPSNMGYGLQVADLDDDLDIRGPVTTMSNA